MQRWMRAGCFETMLEDLRSLLREFVGRNIEAKYFRCLCCWTLKSAKALPGKYVIENKMPRFAI
jgi:hypothetical protein